MSTATAWPVTGGRLMLGDVKILLYVSKDVKLHISCNGKTQSDKIYRNGTHIINFKHTLKQDLEIKIEKTGAFRDPKTHKVHNQIVKIKKLIINDINCLDGRLGTFRMLNNFYVKDDTIQTNDLYLNGTWVKKIKYFDYFTNVSFIGRPENEFKTVDIALFGASFFARGTPIKDRWFAKLAKKLNCTFEQYSAHGGTNEQIFSNYRQWKKNNSAKIIVFGPTTFSKRIMSLAGVEKQYNIHITKKELFSNLIDEISNRPVKEFSDVLFWEGLETIMSLQIPILYDFFETCSQQSKIYVLPTIFAERKYFDDTILKKYLLPSFDYVQTKHRAYPNEEDNKLYIDKLEKCGIIKEIEKCLQK